MSLVRNCIRYLPTLVFATILSCITAYQPYNNGPAIRSDGQGYHIWTFALKKWDFRFCEYQRLGYAIPTGFSDRCIVKWPPGVALFRFPVMAWFVDVDNHASFSPGEHRVSLLFGAVLTLAIYLIALNVLTRLRVSVFDSQAILFALFFGTGLFHYGTYDNGFSHIYSAFGSMVLVWQLARMKEQAREHAWDGPLPAVTAFFMILFRNTNALIVLFSMLLVAFMPSSSWNRRRLLSALGIGCAIGVAVQLSYNRYASGGFSLSSYTTESFVWDRPMVRSVLFSFERGLFTYYPVMLLVLAVGLWRRGSRAFTAAAALLVLAYATLYGFWHSWYLGGGFGHRGFVEVVPWVIPAFGLAFADIDHRPSRRWILVAAALTLFVPLQVMFGYWRGSFPFERVSEAVYWRHLFGGAAAAWVIAAGVGLFVATGKLETFGTAAAEPHRPRPDLPIASMSAIRRWRVAAVMVSTFALTLGLRVTDLDRHFWMSGDQIRVWSLALGSFGDLPLTGPSADAGGRTLGPAFYWIVWLIRAVIGPWFDNLPHAGAVGLSLLHSAADALFLAAVWKRTASFWAGLTAVLLLVTAPVDLSLASTIWNPAVASTLAETAVALVLLDWHRRSAGRAALTAAVAWMAVHAYSGALLVTLAIFAALIVDDFTRRDSLAVWQRGLAIAAVVTALQIPYVIQRIGDALHPPAPTVSTGAETTTGAQLSRLERNGASYLGALTAMQGVGWGPKTTGWILLGCAVGLGIRWRGQPEVLAVTLLPQVAVAGYALQTGSLPMYQYLPLLPAVVLTVLLGAIAIVPRRLARATGIALFISVLLIVPARLSVAATMYKRPTYRALVIGSREIAARNQPIRAIETRFQNDLTADSSFVLRILGGRIYPNADWRAVILPDGRVVYSR